MPQSVIERFLADCERCCDEDRKESEIVLELAPRMESLLAHADQFLTEEHLAADPDGYARHAVYICPEGGLSLFTMVWSPGQWTPIHDHGTWGVVGVVRGMLEERSFVRMDNQADQRGDAHEGIDLARGGCVLLTPGSVTTFVPNPDHIHRTGCGEGRETTVTLHLYGREMSNYHVYNVEQGTRKLIDVGCTEPPIDGA